MPFASCRSTMQVLRHEQVLAAGGGQAPHPPVPLGQASLMLRKQAGLWLLPLALAACFRTPATGVSASHNVYAPSACADVELPRRADSLDKLVITRMREDRIPAVQLSVLRRGRVETRGYGSAELDHCVPADSNTIFGIGSVSKQLTAYATLRLVDAGSMTLHDPITKYLPEARPAWGGITIRHLLP